MILRDASISDRHAFWGHRVGVAVPDATVHAGGAGGAPWRVPYVAAEFCLESVDCGLMSGCLWFCLSRCRDFQRCGHDLRGVRFHRLRHVHDHVVDLGLHRRYDLCLLRRGTLHACRVNLLAVLARTVALPGWRSVSQTLNPTRIHLVGNGPPQPLAAVSHPSWMTNRAHARVALSRTQRHCSGHTRTSTRASLRPGAACSRTC